MWIFIIIVIVAIIAAISQGNANNSNFEKRFKKKASELIPSGTYVSGHPRLNESIKNTSLLLDSKEVKIICFEVSDYAFKSTIEKKLITNVVMEDSSTIQTRVGIKRLLLTGIFAFAWKKKEKLESAYIVIEWKENQFNNETVFEFEGNGSIQKANTLRNKFINYLSTEEKEVVNIPQSENDQYIDLIKKGRKG